MIRKERREQARAIFLAAIVVLSMIGVGFTGSVAAATNDGPEEFTDQGTDAGLLAAGETAVVQTIEVNDTDESDDTNATELTSVNVNNTTANEVSSSNVSEISILSSDGTELASSTSTDSVFNGGQEFNITNVTISDDGNTEIQVQVTIASDATENGTTLGLQTQASWTEGDSSNTTSYVSDEKSETLDVEAPDLSSASTADSNNDGTVDTVSVGFNETVNNETVSADDFTLSSGTVDSVDTSSGDSDTFDLTVSGVGDTAATPDINVTTGSIEDVAGNTGPTTDTQVTATDAAQPVVTDATLNKTLVNDADAPANVQVDLTFSENITNYQSGDVQIDDTALDTAFTVDGDTPNGTDNFTGTASIGDGEDDVVANLTVSDSNITDGQSNSLVAYDQEALTVDTNESLVFQTAETADLDDDGYVDTVNATFDDDVDDNSVLTAIENGNVYLDTGTLTGLSDAGTTDDAVVNLNASNVGDTASTDNFVISNSAEIYDTAGNLRPTSFTSGSVDDGASPVITDITLNDTVINKSEAPVDVQINATFSEDVADDPKVETVGLATEQSVSEQTRDGDDFLSVVVNIKDDTEDVKANIKLSNGNDSSGNTIETFNEPLLTVDTEAPNVTVNGEAPEGEVVGGELDLTAYFDIQNDDGGETTYFINTTQAGTNYTEVSGPLSFDSTAIEDTAYLNVKAVDTDDVGNEDDANTTAINVDNTAPDVTIDTPTETQASQSGGTLTVETSVTEQNVDENATVVLESSDNYIEYNASTTDLDDGVDLRLNTSENASADGARLPDLNATNGTFDTQTVYDLSVTVDDTTNKSTTETFGDALFLDDTKPDGLALLEPNDDNPTEYGLDDGSDLSDELQIAYGYTEDNTNTTTVELTNESGTVASTTVDESLYVDDGVIKSFELDLVDSFDDADTLADGRYNVSVTVTDLAGNEKVSSTSDAPVYINEESPDNVEPIFQEEANASADLNGTTEEVTVDVDYNITVPEVEDPGAINVNQDSLKNVAVTSDSDLVTLTVDYYDESAGEYVSSETTTGSFTISDANATPNASVTETATIDLADFETGIAEDESDRVLSRSVKVDGNVTVTATSAYDVSNSSNSSVTAESTTLEEQDAIEPDIKSVEVDGPDTPNDALTITFDRPVEAADGTVTTDDFAYEDVSGGQTNYVDDVTVSTDNNRTITVTLAEDANASDVGSDVVSIQPDVLQNTYSTDNISAVNGTVDETTAPAFTPGDVDIGEDASTVDVEFDQPVVAAESGALTADNFNYSGEASVDSVEHSPESSTVTVYLDSEVTSTELGSESIESYDISDRFDNVANDSVTVVDETSPSALEILEPTEQQIVTSDDLLDVSYQYVDNVPDNVESAEVKLESQGETYIYSVDDTSYVTNVSKSLTLDLDAERANLTDGAYDLNVTVTDADDNTDFDVTKDSVVVNDDAPNVENVDINGDTEDIAPDSTIEVEYDYSPAPNATSVTVWVVDTDENSTYTAYEKDVDHGVVTDETLTVDLAGEIADNDNYDVFVTATDVDNKWSNAKQSSSSLDVNAEKPEIVSVEGETADNTVTVQFSEDVRDSDGDEITRADFAYQNVNNAGAASIDSVTHEGDTVTLYLNEEVTAGDLGNDKVNARSDAIADTDQHDQRLVNTNAETLADTTQPVIFSASAESGSDTVTVGFSEQVYGDNGSAITAENLTYDGDNEIVEVEHEAGDRGAIVTLNESVTDGDMAPDGDTIAASEETPFVDSVDNEGTGSATLDYQLISDFEATSDGETVTVSFNASNELSSTEIVAYNIPIPSLEEDRLGDHKTTSLPLDDFEEENGTYTGTFEAPRDGTYYVDMWSVVDVTENSQYGGSDSVTVDTETVSPDEAVIYDVAGSENNKETEIRVTFTEPINGEDITRDDVSIDGIDDEDIRYVSDYRPHGAINVHVEDDANTGDSPNVTIDGDSYTALADASETGAEDGSATIITDRLDLTEGTNFVSVPAAAGSLSLDEVDTSDVNAIWTYDAAAEKWQVYDPEAPDNDLDALEGGVGYIIEMDDGTNATWDVNVHNVPGEAENVENSVPNSNDLTEGWNLIGHYQEHDQTVETGLSSMNLENNEPYRLYAQADGSATMEYQSFQAGDFENMERGEAYWVFVQDDETYTEAPAVRNVA